jgi:hypothetical protein
MGSLIYQYTTATYHQTVLPKGPSEPPNREHYRTVSKILQPPIVGIHTPFALPVTNYIQHLYRFDYKPFPDAPVSFAIVIDISPQNDFFEPHYSLQYSHPSGLIKYFVRWDCLPCTIPHFLYKGLHSRATIFDLNLPHLIQEVELWWGHLLFNQNILVQHLRQTHILPYLPNSLHSPILRPANPRIPSDPLEIET